MNKVVIKGDVNLVGTVVLMNYTVNAELLLYILLFLVVREDLLAIGPVLVNTLVATKYYIIVTVNQRALLALFLLRDGVTVNTNFEKLFRVMLLKFHVVYHVINLYRAVGINVSVLVIRAHVKNQDNNVFKPCTTPREMCGHVCAAPCHEGKCPDTPCKEMVKVTCQCGHRSMSRVCAENSKEYQRIASSILASKMTDMQLGHSINLDQVFGQGAKKQNQLKTLECNDECKTIERNRKLALGLQIVNPDLSGKLMPKYSDFMKQWAKKNPQFVKWFTIN